MGKKNFVENIYNVYCDESRVENPESNRMVIGALEVLRKEAPAIKTHLKDIYKTHDFKYELKWTKVHKGFAPFYKALIDCFLTTDSTAMAFRCIVVDKDKRDFDHIFYEPDRSGGYQFSFRRARRMSFMKEFLSGEIDVEIMFEPDRGTIALFSLELESVMYLRIRLGSGTFQVGTFFDFGRDHSKMYKKQKRKCKPITIEEIRKMIR